MGAGSAGSVVAARLSEIQDNKVLVLEAGGEEDDFPNTHVPYRSISQLGSQIDWQYKTVPQKHACQSSINQV